MWIRKRRVLPAALLILLTGVQAQTSVTLSTRSFCVIIGSTVKIPCTFKKPSYTSVAQKGWYRVQTFKGEIQYLSEDPQYTERVSVKSSGTDCELTLSNVRVSDSGVYIFRFKITNGDWISPLSGVKLTVTGLTVIQGSSKPGLLRCTTSCTLSNTPTYIWYKNGQQVSDVNRKVDNVYVYEAGSYSCAVKGHEDLRSPAVCVYDESSCWSGTYPTQTICSLIGSSVDVHSYFTYPNKYKVTESFWFVKKRSDTDPVDLSKDKEYRDRVHFTHISQNHCRLTITNLEEKDAQTYGFRFLTDKPTGKYTSEPGVSLSVTGLTVIQGSSKPRLLRCTTTCTLSNTPTYIWYKNGQQVSDVNRKVDYVYVYEAGSYSCAVKGHEDLRSPAVCVYDESSCWSVTYPTQTICSLIGSSVDVHSYFTYPNKYKVTESFWFVKKRSDTDPVDLSKDKEYRDRVHFTHISQNHCRLTITNLEEKDAQTYGFRFLTDKPTGKYTSEPGVSLSVTDLKVTVTDLSTHYKKLSCTTTNCNLSKTSTYIWYENGQKVANEYRTDLYVNTGNACSYSCAVRGLEDLCSPAVYSPRNTAAVIVPSGETVEGVSVTLTCGSDGNPPDLTYAWYMKSDAADTLMTTGQNYSISNVSSQHSGLYYCTAFNQLGHHNATPTRLNVFYPPRNTAAVIVPSGETVEGVSVTLTCGSDGNPPDLTYAWYMKSDAADTLMTTGQNYSISNVSSQHSGLYYCTAFNQLGHHNATPTRLNVFYPPRRLSVTVVPYVSGDSIKLKCTSDSNPVSSYTWYRKTNDGVMQIGNGTSLILSSRENGFHYCTARNGFGSTNSSEWTQASDIDNRALKYLLPGVTVALVLISIAAFWWMRRRKPVLRIKSGENSRKYSAHVYGNVSAVTSDPTQTGSSEGQDDVQYSSIYFSPSAKQEVPLYSSVQLPMASSREEEEVEYTTVRLVNSGATQVDVIYSNLSKK